MQYSSILSDMHDLMYFHFHNNQTLSQWRVQMGNNRNVFTCGKSRFRVPLCCSQPLALILSQRRIEAQHLGRLSTLKLQ